MLEICFFPLGENTLPEARIRKGEKKLAGTCYSSTVPSTFGGHGRAAAGTDSAYYLD